MASPGPPGPMQPCAGPGTCASGLVCCAADGLCREASSCHFSRAWADSVAPPNAPRGACPSCPQVAPPRSPVELEAVPSGLPCGPGAQRVCPWVFGGDLCCAVVPGAAGKGGAGGRPVGACVPCDQVPAATGAWYWDEGHAGGQGGWATTGLRGGGL